MVVHPQSFRALAYEVLNHLTANGANDDNKLTLPIIEQELRHQTGIAFDEKDREKKRLGEEPEAYRLIELPLTLTGTDLLQSVELPGILTFNGKPYVTFCGPIESESGFTPCDYRWQLSSMAALNEQPSFCVEAEKLWVRLTEDTVLVEDIYILCVLSDLFPDEGRSNTWYWKQAWNIPEDLKGKIKLQTIRVFMQTHIQLVRGIDRKNNGTDQ